MTTRLGFFKTRLPDTETAIQAKNEIMTNPENENAEIAIDKDGARTGKVRVRSQMCRLYNESACCEAKAPDNAVAGAMEDGHAGDPQCTLRGTALKQTGVGDLLWRLAGITRTVLSREGRRNSRLEAGGGTGLEAELRCQIVKARRVCM